MNSQNDYPRASETESRIIYGIHAATELVMSRPYQIEKVYFNKDTGIGPIFALLKQCRKSKVPCQMIPERELDYIAGTPKHQGVVCICPAKDFMPWEDVVKLIDESSGKPPLLYIAAGVEDPRNLGAIVRSCVAFGVTALILEKSRTAPIGAVVAKASAGMLEHCAITRPHNLAGALADLITRNFIIVGAQAGEKKTPADIDFKRPTVIITGGEHEGIPPYLGKICTDFVGIPISTDAESLNVSVAGSILLYECARQREFAIASRRVLPAE